MAPAWPKAWGEENELSMAQRRPVSTLGCSMFEWQFHGAPRFPLGAKDFRVQFRWIPRGRSTQTHLKMLCHFPLNLGERLLETGRPPLVQNPIESKFWLRASFSPSPRLIFSHHL
ncbi:hypothetical protein GGI43DRAFT_382847 [Trichoderma evansii]